MALEFRTQLYLGTFPLKKEYPSTLFAVATIQGEEKEECPETMSRELKGSNIYRLFRDMDFEQEEYKSMFKDNDFAFIDDNLLLLNINNMFSKYVHKYICSFFNTDLDRCQLIFGLSDDGEVDALLIPKSMTATDFKTMIMTSIDELLTLQDFSQECHAKYLAFFEKHIQINLIPVSNDCSYIDDCTSDIIAEGEAKLDAYNRVIDIYKEKCRRFVAEVEFYKRSIVKLLMDTVFMTQLIAFILETPFPESSGITEVEALTIKSGLISRIEAHLNGATLISFYNGQISAEKMDVTTLAHWFTKCRDDNVRSKMKQRPKRDEIARLYAKPKPYKNAVFSNPIKRIITSYSTDVPFKLCVLEIVMPGANIATSNLGDDYTLLSYMRCNKRKIPIRMMGESGPCCMSW